MAGHRPSTADIGVAINVTMRHSHAFERPKVAQQVLGEPGFNSEDHVK